MVTHARSPVHISGTQAYRYFFRFLLDPLATVERAHNKFGPFIIINYRPILWQRKFFKRKAAAVAIGPDFNQEILSDPVTWQTVSIGSGPRNSAARRVSVELVSLQGDKHKYYRQLFIPPMSRKNIDAQSDLIGNTAVAEVERWPLNETIDLWACSRALLQNFAITLLFGNDCARGIPVAELIHQLFSNTASWPVWLFPFNISGTPYNLMLRDGELLQSRIFEWAKCRRRIVDSKDLLSIVTNSPNENGAPHSEAEIAAHIPTLLGAAFETCQNTLIWTLVLLSQHPRIARDLLDELRNRLAGAVPSLELIRDLPLLDAVINESMRILPPVPQQFRVATKDTALANFPVRSRTKVLISPFLTNRNPDLYPEPDCFKPERWSSIKPSSYEFFVFSAGPRACPGFWFGTSVLKVAIAAIMTRFHIVLAPNARIDYKVRLALSPNGNVPATLKRQDGAVTRSSIQGSIRNLVRFPN